MIELIGVELVYSIQDEDTGQTNHVRYPLELTRAGVSLLVQAADEIQLDHGAE
jgi:hypothetical protein